MLKWFSAFFAFGELMCTLTIVLLLCPGTPLDILWQLNPEAQAAFQSIGWVAIAIMAVVGTGCASAAVGLWRGKRWGIWIAVSILVVNIIGDLLNALLRGDHRALIGLPIGGAMIFYLVRSAKAARPSVS